MISSLGRELSEAPHVFDIEPETEAAMFAAKARAHQLGLSTRSHIVVWVRAPRGAARGCTVVASDSMVRVYLRDDLGPHDTYETMLHELQHVSDAAILGALGDVAEERADAFMARASQAASRPWRLMMGHRPTTRFR